MATSSAQGADPPWPTQIRRRWRWNGLGEAATAGRCGNSSRIWWLGRADGGRRAHRDGANRACEAAAARRTATPRSRQGAQVPVASPIASIARTIRGEGDALALARQRHCRLQVLPLRCPQVLAQGSFPSPICRLFIRAFTSYSVITPVISLRWYRGHCMDETRR